MWPSFESACQRIVYGPFGSRGTVATSCRAAEITCGEPARSLPLGVSTWIRLGQRVDRLVELEDDPARRTARAPARTTATRASASHARTPRREARARRTRRATSARLIGAALPRTATGGRRSARRRGRSRAAPRAATKNVANPVAATSERGRNACTSGKTAQTSAVQPSAWCRNAAREKSQWFCSCDDERRPRDEQRERRRQPPVLRVQLPARETELRRAAEHQHLRPRSVRDHVDRRVREERHHGPHQDPHPEADARPEIRPPATDAPRSPGRRPPRRAAAARASGSRWRSPSGRTPPAASARRRSRLVLEEIVGDAGRDDEPEEDADGDHVELRLGEQPPDALAAAGAAASAATAGARPRSRRRGR